MRDPVIVSYARTGMPKAGRGGFNDTPGMTLMAHSIEHAVSRAGVDPAEVEDCHIGTVQGDVGNLGRLSALLAGLPKETAGLTINRFCSSGVQAIVSAAGYIRDGADIVVAGGVESLSTPSGQRDGNWMDSRLIEQYPAIFMAMIDTADIVAKRYNVSREAQDEFSLQSQQRMAAFQEAGKDKEEIVPLKTKMKVVNKETKEESIADVVVDRDDCNRPNTTLEGLAKLAPVMGPDKFITAGNASQLTDGSAAVVMMEAKEAERRNLEPMGAFRGWAVAGCAPDEMGIGPVFSVPRLLERNGLKVDDIDLWELNEAFASQCLYCRDTLGIDPEKYNVNGGAIAIGHPFGMTGARCTGTLLLEGKRRKAKYGVVTMCIGGGQGGSALFEIY